MTAQIVYHDSNGNTVDINTNDFREMVDFGPKTIYWKSNKASIVHDPNRHGRVFQCSTILSRADKDEMQGYAQPAAAPTYDANFPKIVWTKDEVPTTETIICMIVGYDASQIAHGTYIVRLQFLERYS